MEFLDYPNQVFQRTGQPVQFPDNQNIALSEGTQTLRQLRSFPELAGKLLLKDLFATGFLQSIDLELRILILGTDTCISYDHQTSLFWP
jgi:hypothetical protein